MFEVMVERVAVELSLEIALPIEFGVEAGRGIAALAMAAKHEMLEGIYACGGDILVGLEIVFGVEFGDWTEWAEAMLEIVRQRVLVPGDVIGLAYQMGSK